MRKQLMLCLMGTVVASLYSISAQAADDGIAIPRIDAEPSFADFSGMSPSTALARSMTKIENFSQRVPDDGEAAELRSRITRTESERLLRCAYEPAVKQGRKKVTVVHKANIMKSTSGLFLDVARKVREDYPQLEHEEMIVDACAMQLAMNPHRFDVIVTTNLFGDILSDLCAGLIGGLGVAPGANIGEHGGLFEAVHGSAPDIAGQGIADPTAMLFTTARMLDWLGRKDPTLAQAGKELFDAVAADLAEHGGDRRATREIGDAICKRLAP